MSIAGFTLRPIEAAGVSLNVALGGSGPPLLLLHGYPQTHFIWRHVAPAWARSFSVVAPDLKGYGASDAPAPLEDSSNYSKRALAAECVALMRALGHQRFAVVGHDRGARVAYRMALDAPDVVERLVTLDIIPTGAAWEASNPGLAVGSFHWGFLAQPAPFPERVIGADPDYFLRYLVAKWAGRKERMTEDALEAYCAAYRRPEVIAASCADYRAGATIDNELDRADLAAGRKIQCPTLAILSQTFASRKSGPDATTVWQGYAANVHTMVAPCGHFIPEEAPESVVEPIRAFLAESR